jgi:hypothetical protein
LVFRPEVAIVEKELSSGTSSEFFDSRILNAIHGRSKQQRIGRQNAQPEALVD